ncbi:hypothetical protein [Ureibacillus acetophenoni]
MRKSFNLSQKTNYRHLLHRDRHPRRYHHLDHHHRRHLKEVADESQKALLPI